MCQQRTGRSMLVVLVFVLLMQNTVMLDTYSHTMHVDLEGASASEYVPSNLTPHEPIEILSDDDFISQGWPGNGTWDDPYLIEGLNITGHDISAVRIISVTRPFMIRNCSMQVENEGLTVVYWEHVSNGWIVSSFISQGLYGLRVRYSSNIGVNDSHLFRNDNGAQFEHVQNISLSQNLVAENYYVGIFLWSVTSSRIAGNLFHDNNVGIMAGGAQDSLISGNEFVNGAMGVYFEPSGKNSSIQNNTFLNVSCGVIASSPIASCCSSLSNVASYDGLADNVTDNHFTECKRAFVNSLGRPLLFSDNLIERCGVGIDIRHTGRNLAMNNTITDSTEYGIYVENADHNIFYGNIIMNSGISNARDGGRSNTWDNGVDQGNFWSDYNGTGTYNIPGIAVSVDRWPERVGPPYLCIDNETEIIAGPDAVLIWKAYDADPLSYEIYMDDELIESGVWDGFGLTLPLNELEPGTYNFCAIVTDMEENSSSASILVHLVSPWSDWFVPSAGAITIVIVIVGVFFVRKRRTMEFSLRSRALRFCKTTYGKHSS